MRCGNTIESGFILLLKFLDYGSEKHVDDESVDGSLVVDIEDSEEVRESLRSFFIFHGEYEIKECFVVHFTFEGLTFFEDSIDENSSKTPGVSLQF